MKMEHPKEKEGGIKRKEALVARKRVSIYTALTKKSSGREVKVSGHIIEDARDVIAALEVPDV